VGCSSDKGRPSFSMNFGATGTDEIHSPTNFTWMKMPVNCKFQIFEF
jgi:hypothetical protein